MPPFAARMPSAIGRSKRPPSLGRSAGARLTVIAARGYSNCAFWIAARTRSRASFTAVSGRPTIEVPGRPPDRCTSHGHQRRGDAVQRAAVDDGEAHTYVVRKVARCPARGELRSSGASRKPVDAIRCNLWLLAVRLSCPERREVARVLECGTGAFWTPAQRGGRGAGARPIARSRLRDLLFELLDLFARAQQHAALHVELLARDEIELAQAGLQRAAERCGQILARLLKPGGTSAARRCASSSIVWTLTMRSSPRCVVRVGGSCLAHCAISRARSGPLFAARASARSGGRLVPSLSSRGRPAASHLAAAGRCILAASVR